VPDPLPLARMRALRLVAVPWAEEELALLQETAATAGRRLIDVTGDHGARALMLGWPADVDPMAVLGADGEDLPGATPTTCLVLAACIGCCWPDPDAPLLPGIPVPENQVLDALASFTRPGRPASESLRTRQAHWKSAIRRLRACGFLVPEEQDSLIRLGPALAGWGDADVRYLRDRHADLPRLAGEPA
jgi:hypothetical protein